MIEASSADRTERRAQLLRKLHALTGAFLGALLVVHLCANAAALGGRAAYDRVVGRVHASPLFGIFEVLFVFAPLAFYVVYGVVLARAKSDGDGNGNGNGGAPRTTLDVLHRVTGLVIAVFVIAHVGELRGARAVSGWGAASLHTKLVEHLSWTVWGLPLTAIAYLVAVAASAFHVAYGLSRAARSRGFVALERQKRADVAIAAFGVGLFLVGAASVITLATGRFLPAPGGRAMDPRCETPSEAR